MFSFFYVLQACLCVLLEVRLDINDGDNQNHANKANDIVLCVNIVIMAMNVVINSFDMKESDNICDNVTAPSVTTPLTGG